MAYTGNLKTLFTCEVIAVIKESQVTTAQGKQGKQGKSHKKIPCMENSGNLKNSLKHRENTGKNLQPEGGIRKRRRKIWERAAFGIIEVNMISHHCNFLGKITGKIYRGTGKTQGIWKWNLCGHPVLLSTGQQVICRQHIYLLLYSWMIYPFLSPSRFL